MLETLRRGATKALVFALLAILVLSFAVWGIGDVVRQSNQAPIAEVGGKPIAAAEFTAAMQNRRQMFARQMGQPLTPEQSRAFGIDSAVLSELVNGAAIGNHARAMGLRLSDKAIADQIRSDPAFHGPDQTFNRVAFDERIRQAGYTEQRYFAERRDNEVREQLTEALVEGVVISDAQLNLAHRFREETRSLNLVRLDPAKVPKPADPDEKSLKSVYDEQKRIFTEPERRRIAVLMVSADDLRARAKVEDAEVKASWEQARAAWDMPERRRIQQIFFKTKAEAQGEAKAIEGGKSFLMAALEANGAQGRLDQGLVARREISDQGFAKAAFDLALNKVSEPVAVKGGFLLVRVGEIQPARARPFEEVSAEVRQGLEDTKRREIADTLHKDIEDRRGAAEGSDKLKKIATDLKLKLIEAEGVDAKGRRADGKAALDHPDAERILAAAFEGDETTPREVIALTSGGEAWLDVTGITKEDVRPFESVKAEVEKLWREREARRALTTQGTALAGRIKAGETFETIAKELGATIESTEPFKRAAPPKGVAAGAARLAFTLPKGGAGSAATADEQGRMVFVVADIKLPEPPTKEAAEALKREIGVELQRDALQTYVGALRQRQGVKINEASYKRAVGLDQVP